jgi:hypothetical protein
MNFWQELKTFTADQVYPIEILAKRAGVHMTAGDASLYIRALSGPANAAVMNNIMGKKGFWAFKNGEFKKALDFNYKTLLDELQLEDSVDAFGHYLVARDQHFQYVELEKLNVEITVQGTNLNIIRGDKLPIVLIQKDRFENLLVDKKFTKDAAVEFFYTGWYYVKGFNLSWIKTQDPVFSDFSQTFVLTRREWPAPVPVDAIKKE